MALSRLTEVLVQEHAAILAALDRIRQVGPGSRQGREALLGARALLLAHLAREDAELYPQLRVAAARDARLARALTELDGDLARLGPDVSAFFERWAAAPAAGLTFATELGRLSADLRQRIRKEELLLFPAARDLESVGS